MFTNILRTQARLALVSCRARIPASSISRVATRFPSFPTVSPASRAISTSRPVFGFNDPTSGNIESQTIYVGNLPFSVTPEDIKEKFAPFGLIQDIRLAYHADGRSRGFAHVEFADLNDAIAAHNSIKEEPMYMLDRDIRIDYAAARNRNVAPSGTLYFHGFRGTIEDLKALTQDVEDTVLNIIFLRNRETGEETGAGFIHFNDTASAEQALKQLNGRQAGEDILRLRFAAPRRDRRTRED